MRLAPHVDSYYALSAHPSPARAALQGAAETDVCVVGGGLAGCSTALHLAERGYRVTLLEERRIGWGASGRSGAQALHGIACGQQKLERLVGREDAKRIFDVTVEGLRLLRELVARHGIDCDLRDGQVQVALKPRHAEELRAEQDLLATRYGYEALRLVERGELSAMLGTGRYSLGLLDTGGAHLHPLNYTLGLAAAAERAGARIHESTRALSWEVAERVVVQTPQGEVRCRQLVLCGNAYLGSAAPELARQIMAVATYIVATAPLAQPLASDILPSEVAVTDMNWVLDYFRKSADRRLLFGGRVSYSGLDARDTAQATRRRMLAVYPQLADVAIEHAWGGYVDITRNRAPHFGRLAPNVWFLQGFSGHGIALTGIAGRLVADAIAGTAERFDVFARIPHRSFPGGRALRRPALVLAMLWYRLRDLL